MMAVELFGSRVSTCLISILLIVYGSFRSLNMEQEAREKEKKRQSESSNNLLTGEPVSHDSSMGVSLNALIVLKRFSWHRFWLCDIGHDARTLPAIGRFRLASCDVLLLRLHANAFRRLYSKWVCRLFFPFDASTNYFYCLSVIATVALAFLLLPMCQYIIRPCTDGHRMSLGCCGRFTAAELLSFTMSITVVCIWVLTGHWLLMDAMVRFISTS